MQRNQFMKLFGLGAITFSLKNTAIANTVITPGNRIQLLRHATLVLEINGKKILVDPMLAPKDAVKGFPGAGNDFRNPMLELPMNGDALKQLLASVDMILITHMHSDHWDAYAREMIDKERLLVCQPEDEKRLHDQGFKHITPVPHAIEWEGIKIHRTGGQHGHGEMAKDLAPVSGFVLETRAGKIYIVGDSVYCDEVKAAIEEHKPQTIVLNAGGAEFNEGGPITMTTADIELVKNQSPQSKLICVHMDSINHCRLKRSDLRAWVREKGISGISIPNDGEIA